MVRYQNSKKKRVINLLLWENGKLEERNYVFTTGEHFYPIYDASNEDKSIENILYTLNRKSLKLNACFRSLICNLVIF